MYEYLWVLTVAQINLIALDQPMVVYDHDNKRKKGEFKKANPLDVLRTAQKYEQSGADKPKAFDLSAFRSSEEGESKQ